MRLHVKASSWRMGIEKRRLHAFILAPSCPQRLEKPLKCGEAHFCGEVLHSRLLKRLLVHHLPDPQPGMRTYSLLSILSCLPWAIAQNASCASSRNTTVSDRITAAANAWVYGLPAYAIQQTRNYYLGLGIPLNSVVASPGLSDASQRSIVRPNADTIYSIAFFDLSQGPVSLQIPTVTDRYFVAAMYDAYTNNFANPGTVGNDSGGLYTLIGPSDAGCANATTGNKTIVSPTNDVWMIARFYVLNATTGSTDLATVKRLQSQLYVVSSPMFPISQMPAFSNTTSQAYQSFYGMNQAVSDNPIDPAQYTVNFSKAGLISGRSFRSTMSAVNLTTAQMMGNTSISASVGRTGALRTLNNGWIIPTVIGLYGVCFCPNLTLPALIRDRLITWQGHTLRISGSVLLSPNKPSVCHISLHSSVTC